MAEMPFSRDFNEFLLIFEAFVLSAQDTDSLHLQRSIKYNDMKNATLKLMLCSTAVASAFAASAQTLSFTQEDIKAKCVNEQTGEVKMDSIFKAHRTTPFVADFNNDGWMDIYYGGTSWSNGWATRGVLLQNLGERKWEMFIKPAYEEYSWEEPVVDDEGNPVADAEGNPVTETKYGTREVTGLMDNGLPKSAWTMGSIPVDINADGLVDMVLSNQGGNDTHINGGIHIVKNLGNMQFRWMNHYDADLDALLSKNTEGNDINEGNKYGDITAADYDKDGYTDLLVQFYQEGDNGGRRTLLLHNIRGERFEAVNVFKPLPFEQEINKRGIYEKTAEVVDPDMGTTEPGSYIDTPTMKMHSMTHGQVHMVDLDGDTWPDILVTGWMDGEDASQNGNGEEQVGGWNIRFYHNCQDGTFEDKTLEVLENFVDNAELISDENKTFDYIRNNFGKDDVVIYPMDWNNDGTIDLLFLGSVEIQNGWKSSLLWENYSNEDGFHFEQTNFRDQVTPTTGLTSRMHQFIDINADDYVDLFVASGWMNNLTLPEPGGDWFYGLMLNDGNGGVTLVKKDDAGYWAEEQSACMADLDNDGKLDVISCGTGDENERISWNTTDGGVMQAPATPDNVSATAGDGTITLTWDPVYYDGNGQSAAYNVYCKNLDNGEIRMMAPANLETGKQQAYPPFYYYLVRGDEPTYTFEKLPKGSYEVGVQSVAYSYASSEFAKFLVDVTESTGVKSVKAAATLTVTVNGNNIIASSNETAKVSIYNAQGAQVATGMTNEAIAVNGHGVFVVKAGDSVAKVVK